MTREEPPDPGERGAELDRLRDEVRFLRAVLQCAGGIICATDLEGRVIEWSEGAEKLLGYTRAEMLGRPAVDLYVNPEDRARLLARMDAASGAPVADYEVAMRRRDGKKIWVALTLAALRDGEGRTIGTVGVAKDMTERRRLERELRRLSVTDKLTGLFNQSHFYELLEIEKERAARLLHPLALVLFDLDRFKAWNDRAGHDEGDRVLRAVGGVIFAEIRKEVDSGFRYGGDEFCVLLPGTTGAGAIAFAERLRAGVERLGIGGITASLGIAELAPGRQIVKCADAAMYRAKRSGGNRICLDGRPGVAWVGGASVACEADCVESC